MIKLTGGPAEGGYLAKSSPSFLRAVAAADGTRYVLDQPEDTPEDGEKVSVYRRTAFKGTVHLNMGRKGSGSYPMAAYEHLPDIDGETLREGSAWREWRLTNAGTTE